MNSMFWYKVDRRYERIGEKIQKLAKWIFVIGAISAIICGFVLFAAGATHETLDVYEDEYYSDPDFGMVIGGIATIVIGPIISLVSTWVLYAFGHLVQITEDNFKLNLEQKDSNSDNT